MTESSKNLGGRPPMYETPEQMQEAIDSYFDELDGASTTITGLALHLGFCDRQSLYDYEEKDAFTCIVKRARLRVEHGYEKRLSYDKPTGAIFALKNMGWSDRSAVELSNPDGSLAPVSDTERAAKVAAIMAKAAQRKADDDVSDLV